MNSVTQAFSDYLQKLLDDPKEMDRFVAELADSAFKEDCQLICAVVDRSYAVASWDHAVAYAMDPEFYEKQQVRAMDLFFQWHGQGD